MVSRLTSGPGVGGPPGGSAGCRCWHHGVSHITSQQAPAGLQYFRVREGLHVDSWRTTDPTTQHSGLATDTVKPSDTLVPSLAEITLTVIFWNLEDRKDGLRRLGDKSYLDLFL